MFSGEIWHRLEDEKSEVAQSLLEGSLAHEQVNSERDLDASDELEWLHRTQLETRLREIGEAQDRLIEALYGRCIDCGEEIDARRLAVDPAAARCVFCQTMIDSVHFEHKH
jgi:RNA polymerase-binding transcription factor DksA